MRREATPEIAATVEEPQAQSAGMTAVPTRVEAVGVTAVMAVSSVMATEAVPPMTESTVIALDAVTGPMMTAEMRPVVGSAAVMRTVM